MTAEEICRELEGQRSHGAPFDRLLAVAVDLLHASDRDFRWTAIYERAPDAELRLGPHVGSPTHQLSRGRNDGSGSAGRVPHVVLIQRGSRIYGQIEIEAEGRAELGDAAVREVERVAAWMADAYELRELVRR